MVGQRSDQDLTYVDTSESLISHNGNVSFEFLGSL